MKVKVVNKKDKGQYDFYVGRPNVLGNPFAMKSEKERDLVCERYSEWLDSQIKANNKKIINELKKIYNHAKENEETKIACWCSPKRCHADKIAEVVNKAIAKNQ